MTKLGKAFADSVGVFRKKRSNVDVKKFLGWGGRVTFLFVLLLLCCFALMIRLFHLTIVKGSEYRDLANGNRVKTNIIHAPRGIIYDRRGIPLVKNIPSFRLAIPCTGGDCSIKTISQEQYDQEKKDLNPIFLEQDFLREYTYSYELAHVLGYLTEISGDELKNPFYAYQSYITGDRIGRMGIEAEFEKDLRGVDGKEMIEVDAQNNKLRTLGKIDAIKGNDITLSIDADLQQVAYEAMSGYDGAVVVSKPKTGEILALVSTPSFDANNMGHNLSTQEYQNLINDPKKLFFNRAISGTYPPGSTFKIITSIAGLEEKVIDKDTTLEDTGIIHIGSYTYTNWYYTQYGGTEGNVDILKAIARSNDTFFYKLGDMLGIDKMSAWGKKFKLGQKSGIELSGEAEGIMPDPAWRKKIQGTDWYLGDTMHVAIGQGDLQTTPLQINLWTNTIASEGIWCKPTLISQKSPASPAGGKIKNQNCVDLGIKPENLNLVIEGMRRACSSDKYSPYQGTGWPLFDFSLQKENFINGEGKSQTKMIPIACKTGTAEYGDAENKTHAIFTAFAPVPIIKSLTPQFDPNNTITGDPEITVTVLIEGGGEGSTVGAPVAKKILEEWFKR